MVWVYPARRGPLISMQAIDTPTSEAVQWKLPEAAAPQITPQIKGIQVTGFISCNRIFQMLLVPAASFMPSSWRAAEPPLASDLGLLVKADRSGRGDFVVEEPNRLPLGQFHHHSDALAVNGAEAGHRCHRVGLECAHQLGRDPVAHAGDAHPRTNSDRGTLGHGRRD